MEEPSNERPLSPARLSKTPSWITLGFVLGVLFMLALPNGKQREAPPPEPPPPPPIKLERPVLSEIEAVFADWGGAAIWQNNVTEVALWDRERRSYSLFYEVLRDGENYYFRSIPRLTRPTVKEAPAENAPLVFMTPVQASTERRLGRPPEPPTFERRPEKLPLHVEPSSAGGVKN